MSESDRAVFVAAQAILHDVLIAFMLILSSLCSFTFKRVVCIDLETLLCENLGLALSLLDQVTSLASNRGENRGYTGRTFCDSKPFTKCWFNPYVTIGTTTPYRMDFISGSKLPR
jgi:hypothetical protein